MIRSRTLRLVLLLPFAAASSLACVGPPSDLGSEPAANAAHPHPVLVETAHWGCADCAAAEQLTPLALAVDSNGTVALVDRYEPKVRIFERQAPPRTWGRHGRGPGEMPDAEAYAIWLGPSGETTVVSLVPPVLAQYTVRGEYRRSTDLPLVLATSLGWDPDRQRLYLGALRSPLDGRPRGIRTLQMQSAKGPGLQVTEMPWAGNRAVDGWSGQFAVAVASDGRVAVGTTERYEIVVVSSDGDLAFRIERDLPKPMKSPEELERDRVQAAAMAARLGTPLGVEASEVRDHFGPSALQFDGRGRLWVHTERTTAAGAPILDVFDLTGALVAEVEGAVGMARHLPLFAISGEFLATAVTRSGYAEVLLYRIEDR